MRPDPHRIRRILDSVEVLWAVNPDISFGQLIEAVENAAWDGIQSQRDFSARLMNLPDEWLEATLNQAVQQLQNLPKS